MALMPQWDFLDFLAEQGRRYPTFHLRMQSEATGLLARPENRNVNARPTMIDLKESGDIEAHSHVIIMPYLPVNEAGEMIAEEQQLIVAKNRNGGVGSVDVYFDPKHLQFAERTKY